MKPFPLNTAFLPFSLEILLSITYKQNFPIMYIIMYGQKQNSGSYIPFDSTKLEKAFFFLK